MSLKTMSETRLGNVHGGKQSGMDLRGRTGIPCDRRYYAVIAGSSPLSDLEMENKSTKSRSRATRGQDGQSTLLSGQRGTMYSKSELVELR